MKSWLIDNVSKLGTTTIYEESRGSSKAETYLGGVSNDGCCRDEGVENELFIAFLRLAK